MAGMNLIFDDFVDELIESGWCPAHDPGHAKIRRLWQSWQPDGYDATCIKILSQEEANARFEWAKPGELAAKYKRDPEWVARGLEACRRSSVDPGYFVQRYLEGNREIPKNELVEQAYLDMAREMDRLGGTGS